MPTSRVPFLLVPVLALLTASSAQATSFTISGNTASKTAQTLGPTAGETGSIALGSSITLSG